MSLRTPDACQHTHANATNMKKRGVNQCCLVGRVAAIARFPDEVPLLKQSGATAVFNSYTEAGAGFAEHVESNVIILG